MRVCESCGRPIRQARCLKCTTGEDAQRWWALAYAVLWNRNKDTYPDPEDVKAERARLKRLYKTRAEARAAEIGQK